MYSNRPPDGSGDENVCLQWMVETYAYRQTYRKYICGWTNKSTDVENNGYLNIYGVRIFDDVGPILKQKNFQHESCEE